MPRSNQTTENRTARLTILIDPRKKKIFEEICAAQDLTPSQVVRKLIRQYVIEHAAGRPLPEWLTVQGKRKENDQKGAASRNGQRRALSPRQGSIAQHDANRSFRGGGAAGSSGERDGGWRSGRNQLRRV
jgi:hypothetical protein